MFNCSLKYQKDMTVIKSMVYKWFHNPRERRGITSRRDLITWPEHLHTQAALYHFCFLGTKRKKVESQPRGIMQIGSVSSLLSPEGPRNTALRSRVKV